MVTRTHPRVLSSSTLEGTSVKNLSGEDVGNIEEIMLDLNSGRVAYAVLSFGGILGIGDKLFAVPWDSLTVDTDNEVIRMDASKERLKNAPGFNKNDWPETPNADWYHEVYDYYNATPYWT